MRILPVDDTLFFAREELRAGLGWHGPVAVSLCSLVPSAGIDLLVQAAAMLRYDHPDLCWVVIGAGELLAPLQRLAAELGVADRVAFTGYVPDEEVKKRLVAADLFMLPTRVLADFSLVAVEAGACGLPVVATPVGANVEVVGSLPHGRLAADMTPEALAWAADALLRARVGDAAEMMRCQQRAAAGCYNWAQHEAHFLQAEREAGG